MVRELILLPVRLGVRATRLWLRAAEETVGIATSATGRLIGMAPQRPGDGPTASPSGPERNGRGASNEAADHSPARTRGDGSASPSRPVAEPTAPAPSGSSWLDAPTAHEPIHVSEEPALVEEFAEPGAEEGAGAEIHVEAPWDGYSKLNAKQIVARLGSATPAELAAVQLYEGLHRRRQTVLNAVRRELRSANGRGSRTQ